MGLTSRVKQLKTSFKRPVMGALLLAGLSPHFSAQAEPSSIPETPESPIQFDCSNWTQIDPPFNRLYAKHYPDALADIDEKSIKEALKILEKTPTGKRLIRHAHEEGYDICHRTPPPNFRRTSLVSGFYFYKKNIIAIISPGQMPMSVAARLSHELSHIKHQPIYDLLNSHTLSFEDEIAAYMSMEAAAEAESYKVGYEYYKETGRNDFLLALHKNDHTDVNQVALTHPNFSIDSHATDKERDQLIINEWLHGDDASFRIWGISHHLRSTHARENARRNIQPLDIETVAKLFNEYKRSNEDSPAISLSTLERSQDVAYGGERPHGITLE